MISYEDACELAKDLWSPDRLRTALMKGEPGLEELRVENREKLAAVGWSLDSLSQIARERMLARIDEMREK